MTQKNKMIFFAPVHRTGSSLLSSILNQNKMIYSEGHSPLCGILWDLHSSLENDFTKNSFLAAQRDFEKIKKSFFDSMINDYYHDQQGKIIIDKSSYWGLMGSFDMIERYIDPDPKIIITRRDLLDVLKSYVKVYIDNGFSQEYAENLLLFGNGDHGGMLMRSIASTVWAQLSKKNNFFFIDYENLVNDTKETIDSLYSFLDIKKFNHDFKNIKATYHEDQKFVLKGLSEVRSGISKRNIDVVLSENAIKKIKEVQNILDLSKKENINDMELEKVISFYNTSLSS